MRLEDFKLSIKPLYYAAVFVSLSFIAPILLAFPTSASAVECGRMSSEVRNFLTTAYPFFFQREATCADFKFWNKTKLEIPQLAAHLAASPEFFELAQTEITAPQYVILTPNKKFLALLYARLLRSGNLPSLAELEFFTEAQISNNHRASIVEQFFLSDEFGRSTALKVTALRCAATAGKRNLDSAIYLKQCINMASKTVLLAKKKIYYFKTNIVLRGRSNLTIATDGYQSIPTNDRSSRCKIAGAGKLRCAVLKAANGNINNTQGPLLWINPNLDGSGSETENSNQLSLKYFIIDGNRDARRAAAPKSYTYWSRPYALNAMIHNCSGCEVAGLVSMKAVGGSGLAISGYGERSADVRITNSQFLDNGNGLNRLKKGTVTYYDQWADGMTVVGAPRIAITYSDFLNNSDIDLVLAGIPGGLISDNLIGTTKKLPDNYAFAGLYLDTMRNNALTDFSGVRVTNNTIDCGKKFRCGIGFAVGPYFYYTRPTYESTGPMDILFPVDGRSREGRPQALIANNSVSQAQQGFLISGALGFVFNDNSVSTSGDFEINFEESGRIYSGLTSKVDVSQPDNLIAELFRRTGEAQFSAALGENPAMTPDNALGNLRPFQTRNQIIDEVNLDRNPDGLDINRLYYSRKK